MSGIYRSNTKWNDRRDIWMRELPLIEQQDRIPRHVIQVFLFGNLSGEIVDALDRTRQSNLDWKFDIFSNQNIEDFISKYYGQEVLSRYQSIAIKYGAARVDLFRYLYIYRCGGVYLDIKSGFTTPLSEAVHGEEGFVLSQWRNGLGDVHEGIGLHPDLTGIEGGEFQNFHIIGTAGHPFLRAVISAVLANIDTYSPWRFSVGRIGVLRVTGPIAYTQAIHPLLQYHKHKRIAAEDEVHLSPFIHQGSNITKRRHYSTLREPVVTMTGLRAISYVVFSFAYRIRKKIQAIRHR